MPFTKNRDSLKSFHEALSSIKEPSHLQILVRNALDDIIQNYLVFNGCISLETPFFKEFFKCMDIQDSRKLDDESCFSLFECIAIFFREKRLRFGLPKLNQTEIDTLHYFENSGHWSQEENTIVSTWYWFTLPKIVIHESVNAH